MMEPKKKVTLTFECLEKESVDFKIRLKHDCLKQNQFFRSILRLYVESDSKMMDVIKKIKEMEKTMGKKKITNSRKDLQSGEEMLSRLGITQNDRENIFDLLELDLESHYE